MTGLVTNRKEIGAGLDQIRYAGVLEAVELVLGRELQILLQMVCSGQAIFLVNEDCGDGSAEITLPYEFLPLPKKGDKGVALNRKGDKVCAAEVVNVRSAKAFDHTNLLTMKVPKEYAMKARFFREEETA